MSVLSLALLVAVASAAGPYFFGCDTTVYPSGVTDSTAYGSIACVTGTLGSANALSCYGWFVGLHTPIIASHIHVGASINANGPIVFNFTSAASLIQSGTAAQGIMQDHWTATSVGFTENGGVAFDAQVSACIAGGACYFNVHTVGHAPPNPAEISCVLQAGVGASAIANSSTSTYTFGCETGQTTQLATGTLAFTTGSVPGSSRSTQVIGYTATYTALTSAIIYVHMHDSTCNSNACSGGPVAYLDFTGAPNSGSFTGLVIYNTPVTSVMPINLTPTFGPGVWPAMTNSYQTELAAGNLYFNIHTVSNAGGEIRAQINSNAVMKCSGSMVAPSAAVVLLALAAALRTVWA